MQFDGQWSRSGLLLWLHLLFYFSPQQVSLDEILYVSLIMTPLTGIEILLKQVYRCMCVWKSVSAFPVFRIVPVHHRHQIDTYWMNEWMNAWMHACLQVKKGEGAIVILAGETMASRACCPQVLSISRGLKIIKWKPSIRLFTMTTALDWWALRNSLERFQSI